jgi:hypothetical protein
MKIDAPMFSPTLIPNMQSKAGVIQVVAASEFRLFRQLETTAARAAPLLSPTAS